MQYLEKHSSEQVYFDIDFSQALGQFEYITGVVSVTADAQATPLTIGTSSVNKIKIAYGQRVVGPYKVVQVLLSGGAVPVGLTVLDYTVRVKVSTNHNPLVEGTVRLRVNDTPI